MGPHSDKHVSKVSFSSSILDITITSLLLSLRLHLSNSPLRPPAELFCSELEPKFSSGLSHSFLIPCLSTTNLDLVAICTTARKKILILVSDLPCISRILNSSLVVRVSGRNIFTSLPKARQLPFARCLPDQTSISTKLSS